MQELFEQTAHRVPVLDAFVDPDLEDDFATASGSHDPHYLLVESVVQTRQQQSFPVLVHMSIGAFGFEDPAASVRPGLPHRLAALFEEKQVAAVGDLSDAAQEGVGGYELFGGLHEG